MNAENDNDAKNMTTGQAPRGLLRGMNPVVTLGSAGLILTAMALAIILPDASLAWLTGVREALSPMLATYYVALVGFFLVFVIWLGMGRYKNVRLGPDDEPPEFATLPWIAMLFAAGTGVGLLFWSIAEPITHFGGNPFSEEAGTPAAAIKSLSLSFFHWGLNGWAIFSVVGLSLAYFSFRRGLPLTIRSALYPLIGDRINGPIGHAVDIFAVVATVFGIATTLGLGASQMNTGLDWLFGIGVTPTTQLVIIAVVTVIATGSVVTGVHRGVRRLSEFNLGLSMILLLVFLVAGPTVVLCAMLVQSTGDYLDSLLAMSFWTGVSTDYQWQFDWTVFYWGWWISWAPFVGMFIARVSKGRTIREFVFGVLLVPSLITFVWIALLGGTALNMELTGTGSILEAVREDVAAALYQTIGSLPMPSEVIALTGSVATLLIAVYFITSADSGTLVITTIMAHGDPEPPRRQRVLWGLGVGALTAVLLVAGGIQVLQDAVITAGLPFSAVMLAMVVGMLRALRDERFAPVPGQKRRLAEEIWTGRDEIS